MLRFAAIFIAVCMVLIASSMGAVLYLFFGMSGAEASVVGLAALTGLALYNTVSTRLRDRSDVGEQIADLSRLTVDLANHMAEIKRNITVAENKVDGAVNRVRAAVEPVTSEIGELGVLVKQLAESVEAHDAMLTGIFSAAEPEMSVPAEPEPALAVASGSMVAPAPMVASVMAPAEPISPISPIATTPTNAGFKALGPAAKVAAIREAVEANRIDLYLQPVVTLPQRKIRFYEALTRLRTDGGEQVLAEDFMPHAEAAGLMPKIDNLLVFRCVQILRRLLVKNRDVGLFCNVSGSTLGDPELFTQFSDFMEANRAIAPALIFEFKQPAYRAMGPIEYGSLASLARQGFRFSMDHVTDLRMEPRELSERGFRYLKVPGAMLLKGTMVATGDIHSADLSDLLARYHIDLIAERIESETSVVDLLDFDVRFGQGFLFSQPRPVRAEAMEANGSNGDSRSAEKGLPPRRAIGEPGVPRLVANLGVVA